MKYILMIIMFVSCIGISLIVNKSKEDRIVILKEIKQSTRAFDIYQYFLSMDTSHSKYLPKLQNVVDNVAQKRIKAKEAKDEIMTTMHQVFLEKSDDSMLIRWLSLVSHPDNGTKRGEVEKQCNVLIEKTKNEEKTNIYIALALGVVLIIILI